MVLIGTWLSYPHVFVWMMDISWFHTSSSSFLFIFFNCMTTFHVYVTYFGQVHFLFIFFQFLSYFPTIIPSWLHEIFFIVFLKPLSSLSTLCAWAEGDLSSTWVIYITLFLTRLWACCGRKGRKRLRARGRVWMSAVKQYLSDMTRPWPHELMVAMAAATRCE